MSLVVHVSVEHGRLPIARRRVADIARRALRAERVRHALLSIAFVSKRVIASLNRRHLGHRGATDVISFGLSLNGETTRGEGGSAPVVGDIYIAPDVARANARAHGVGVREEIARLVVHGTLHVLGYDHPVREKGGEGAGRTASRMWRRQEVLLGRALRPGREA
ncbi:MAG: rRNA maturation RNase YbeY [Gemmatimonadaceae bacterium]